MKQECKVPKKNRFTISEENEIMQAMEKIGNYRYKDYVLWTARHINNQTHVERRLAERLSYQYSSLYTIYNQIRAGVNVEKNMGEFVKEAGKLCQELKLKV